MDQSSIQIENQIEEEQVEEEQRIEVNIIYSK